MRVAAAAPAVVVVVVVIRFRWAQFTTQHHRVAALNALVVVLDRLCCGEAQALVPFDRLLVARLHMHVVDSDTRLHYTSLSGSEITIYLPYLQGAVVHCMHACW